MFDMCFSKCGIFVYYHIQYHVYYHIQYHVRDVIIILLTLNLPRPTWGKGDKVMKLRPHCV